MVELDFPLLPVIGITGSFEGYITGPADLYNKGSNPKNVRKFSSDSSSVSFQNGYILIDNPYTVKFTSDAINTTGYTKLNVHFMSDTYLDDFNSSILGLYTSANGGGSRIASASMTFGRGEKTFTVSFNWATNAYLYLELWGAYHSSSRTYKAYIDRIWLS